MIAFALTGVGIGTILGTRFTMLALIPAMICALTIGAINGILRDLFGPTINELAVLLAFLQIGYLCAATLRLGIRKSRLFRRNDGLPF